MRVSSFLRVLFAVCVSAMALMPVAMSPTGVAAQADYGFVWDATRTCSNGLALRWDQVGAEKIEFSVTNTSESWASDWLVVPDFDDSFHFQAIDRMFDKVVVRVTFADSSLFVADTDTGQCRDRSNVPHPSLDDVPTTPIPGGGGHSGPTPSEGSYLDPVTGNAFTIDSAHRMCADNTLHTTFSGTNVEGVDFTVYNPSPGWGTDWMKADVASGSFSTEIDRDGAYYVDAAVTFPNDETVIVNIYLSDCTPVIADAEAGDSQLIVQIDLPGDADATGAPFDLYVPQAAVAFQTTPYLSGIVGANSTITINGLVPGQYKLVVTPAGSDPIEAIVAVGDQPVTTATVTVNADGTATVAYAGQETPGSADEPAANTEAASSEASASSVSGLPETGVGAGSTGVAAWMAVSMVMIAGTAFAIRRKQA